MSSQMKPNQSKTWSAAMGKLHPCGHTEAQHMYHAEVLSYKLDMSHCPVLEERVVKYLYDLMDQKVGAGEDPIGFLISSHAALVEEIQQLRSKK